jgi:CRP-like cAMP-binding protein
MAMAIRDELTRFSSAFIAKIEIISAGMVPQRLAALMLYLVDRYGAGRKDFQARVPFSIPRDELGNIVGAREETVVRTLTAWKRSGWLETRADGFHVRRVDKLREMVARRAGTITTKDKHG